MRPRDLTLALEAILGARKPALITGPPGVGKSTIVRDLADKMFNGGQRWTGSGRRPYFIDVRAVLLDPVDVRGIVTVDNGKAVWLPPVWLPTDPTTRGILFLDELPQAAALVQSALLQLVLDRMIGEVELAPGWLIVAAGNRVSDRAGSHRIITPLLNRFFHLVVDVSVEDFLAWAIANGVHPHVRGFINYRPELLFQFDPTLNPEAFPTPRIWGEYVSDVLKQGITDLVLLQEIVAGGAGEAAAAEFTGYIELASQIPDIADVYRNPDGIRIPEKPGIQWGLVSAMTGHLKRGDAAQAEAVGVIAERLPVEFGAVLVRDASAVDTKVLGAKSVSKWLRAHPDILV